MKTSAIEVTKLLDKLYNLRGTDSVILKEMESAEQEAIRTKDRTTEEKGTLQNKIAELQEDSKNLNEQGKKLTQVLKEINKNDYEIVIDRLNIRFDPEALVNELETELPLKVEEVNNDIKTSEEALVKVEDEMSSAITTIEEIGIRRDAALEAQEKLNEYFELALSGNINITRDEIVSLLQKFDFSLDEQREAAKLLMFPEDALYDYDNKLKNSEKKSISEVIQEAKREEVLPKEDIEVAPVPKSEPIIEPPVEIKKEEVPVVEAKKEFDKEDLMDLFTEIGLDYLDYTSSDLEEILKNFNEKVIRRNVAIFKNNDLNLDIFVDHLNLLYDRELEAKVDRLMRIGKTALDIYLNPTVLTKYDYRNLDQAIISLQNSGLDPKKVPLMAY